jgi:hypothetical protein
MPAPRRMRLLSLICAAPDAAASRSAPGGSQILTVVGGADGLWCPAATPGLRRRHNGRVGFRSGWARRHPCAAGVMKGQWHSFDRAPGDSAATPNPTMTWIASTLSRGWFMRKARRVCGDPRRWGVVRERLARGRYRVVSGSVPVPSGPSASARTRRRPVLRSASAA